MKILHWYFWLFVLIFDEIKKYAIKTNKFLWYACNEKKNKNMQMHKALIIILLVSCALCCPLKMVNLLY